MFIFTIVLIININSLNNKISNLKEKNSTNKMEIRNLKRENLDLSKFKAQNANKLNFYDEKVVFVIEGYGNYYYTYDCMINKVGNNKYYFWAYNKEQAIGKGYRQGSC